MEKTKTTFLDKPLLSVIKLDWWLTIFIIIMVFASGLRLYDLGSRAYNHDESIHASWSWDFYTGRGYRHNPIYHPPLLYEATALMFYIFGDNDYTGRLSAALFGIAQIALLYFMQKWLGRKGVLVAAALWAISPILLYYGRFVRHDVYVDLFVVWLLILLINYSKSPSDGKLYAIAAVYSLAFASMETTFMFGAIFGTFIVILLALEFWRSKEKSIAFLRSNPLFDLAMILGSLVLPLLSPALIHAVGFDPVDYSLPSQAVPFMQSGAVRSAMILIPVVIATIAVGVWWDWKRWLISAGIFYIIFTTTFTSFFTNGAGFFTGLIGSLGYWLSQQEVARGGQPLYYYFILLPLYEFLPLIFGFAAIIYYAIKGDNRAASRRFTHIAPSAASVRDGEGGEADDETPRRVTHKPIPFMPLLIYWTIGVFILFSWAGEKMPWLGTHLTIPLILLTAWLMDRVLSADWREIWRKGGGWIALIIPLFIATLAVFVRLRPFQGTSIDQLSATTGWIAAIIVMLILLGAIYYFWSKLGTKMTARVIVVTLFVLMYITTIRFSIMAVYKNGDVATEMLIYAQASPDVPFVMKEIERLSYRLTGDKTMKIQYDSDSSWPFVWYLRATEYPNAAFFGEKPAAPFDAPVVLIGDKNQQELKPFLGNRYNEQKYRLVWWPMESYKNLTWERIKQYVTDPVKRQEMWDIFWYRKYNTPLTSWVHVHNFFMYTRKDIAAQLWDYGAETIMAGELIPEDEYTKKSVKRTAQLTWGAQGAREGQFTDPRGLAVDAAGNVYVADSQNHRVQKFDASGNFLTQWGIEGNGAGQFKEPWGVATHTEDGETVVYVADTWNHRVQKFDENGKFLLQWGQHGMTDGTLGDTNVLWGPRDIAVNSAGELYVTDTGNKRILKFDANGTFIEQHGGAGIEPGKFQEPVGIAVDVADNVYVADTWNRRIQKFDPDFNFVAAWDVDGWPSESVVNKPYIAVDGEGRVYITDPENYRVAVFDDGDLQSVFGEIGLDDTAFNLPIGIDLDEEGNLFVVDSGNHRVMKFAPLE